jgi:hypothetical protein
MVHGNGIEAALAKWPEHVRIYAKILPGYIAGNRRTGDEEV